MKNRIKLVDYIRNWKLNSIFVRMMGQLFLLVIVPLCGIMAISYYSYNNMWNRELKRQCSNMADNLVLKWNEIEAEIEQELSFVNYDSEVELFIYDNQLKQKYYDVDHIRKLLLLPALTRDYVDNVYVYSIDNGRIIDKAGMFAFKEYNEKDVLMPVLELSRQRQIVVSESLNTSSKKCILSFWKIEKGKSKALLAMRFSIEKLVDHVNLPEYGSFYIVIEGTIVLSDQRSLIGESVEMVSYYDKLSYEETVRAGDWYGDIRKLKSSDVEIIAFLDSNLIENDLSQLGMYMTFFVGVMIFITVGLAIVISNKLYRPIDEILRFIRKSDAFPDDAEGFEAKDEVEYILKSIEKQAYFAEDVDWELKKRLRLLKKAQAIALQSQINPHFINNTLETIDYMSVLSQGRSNKVSEMVQALSGMLKYSLENTDALVTVREEILYCEQYLGIQRIRYGDKFGVSWNVQPETLNYKIVRMILQPILENAIYHGVKHLPGKGLITISVKRCDDKVRIEITDNGLGMSGEDVEKLKKRLEKDVIQESSHIGLTNVHQRLRLYYGVECSFSIESRLGIGTCVIIEVPCKER